MSFVEPKPKQLQRTIERKKNFQECQSELKVKNKQTAKRAGTRGDRIVLHLIGLESGTNFLDQSQIKEKQAQLNSGLLSTLN